MSLIIESLIGKKKDMTKSRIPAKVDFLQSLTGAILALFILFHIIFESTILFGKDVMLQLTKIFELEFIIEGGSGIFIILLALFIFIIFIAHAFLAMRKFPSSYREYMKLKAHSKAMKHSDTNLWLIQISTGFMLFFLGSIHLYIMLTQPTNIGPYLSSDRIYSDVAWPMYLFLLISVVLHAGAGVYRLIVKWTSLTKKSRLRVRFIVKLITTIYLILGLASLSFYIKIGYEHKDNYGENYTPKTINTTKIIGE